MLTNTGKDKLTPVLTTTADASNWAELEGYHWQLPEPFFGLAINVNRARSLAILLFVAPPLVVLKFVLRDAEGMLVSLKYER